MANTLQIKRRTSAGVPSGLAAGELAVNLSDSKLYVGNAAANGVIQLNNHLPLAGGTLSGNLTLATSLSSASGDLELHRAGSNRLTLSGSSVVINDLGQNIDFRVEGDGDANLIRTDASNDRVGIKTNAPAYTFHCVGTGYFSQAVTLSSGLTVSGTANFGGSYTNFGGGYGATGVSITSAGNIQANGTLTVDGATTLSGNLSLTNSHLNLSHGYSLQWADSHERIEATNSTLKFFTNNGQQMTLSGSSLGIGQPVPIKPLHIKAASPYTVYEDTDDNEIWLTGVGGNTYNIYEDVGGTHTWRASFTTDGLKVAANSYILNSGGIKQIRFKSTEVCFNEDGRSDVDVRMEGDSDANLFFLDSSTDRIGIGCTPSYKLQVNGDVRINNGDSFLDDGQSIRWGGTKAKIVGSNGGDYLKFYTDATERLTISSAGATTLYGNLTAHGNLTSTSTNSDRSLHIATTNTNSDSFIKFSTSSNTSYIGIDDSANVLKINNSTGLSGTNHIVLSDTGHVSINSAGLASYGHFGVAQPAGTDTDGIAVVNGTNSFRLWVDDAGYRRINAGSASVVQFNSTSFEVLKPTTLTSTTQPVLKTAYNADHYLGIGHHYIDLNFSSYTNDLELRTGGTPRLTIHRSTGALQLNAYGGSGLTGTIAKYLAVDSSGNVIQTSSTSSFNGGTVANATTFSSNVTVGVNDTGADVRFWGATAGKYWEWDESDNVVRMRDNVKSFYGDGEDLQIYHDGSNSYITDTGTGDLIIEASDDLILKATGSNELLRCNANSGVDLFHNGTTKLQTLSGGVSVYGNLYFDGVSSSYIDNASHEVQVRGANGVSLWSFHGSGWTKRFTVEDDGKIQIGNNLAMWSGSYGGGLLLKGNNANADRYAQLTTVDSNGATTHTGLIVKNGSVGVGSTTVDKTLSLTFARTDTNVTQDGLSGGAAGKGFLIYNTTDANCWG